MKDEDKLRAIEHIRYEMKMLVGCASMLKSMSRVSRWMLEAQLDERSRQTIKNALLESFGMHARCLNDFLEDKEREVTDIVAKNPSTT
jgi:hypothetical protein